MADLVARNVIKAQLCNFCHYPTGNLEVTICPECEAGEVLPIEVTASYVKSCPHRLRSMARIRRKS